MKRFVFAADNSGSSVYDVSTNVIPIIDVGHYWGVLSTFFDSDYVIYDDSIDDFWNQVVSESMDIIQESFNDYDIPAKVIPGSGSIYHPREYNFSDDELNFSISVNNAWVNQKFEEYKDSPEFQNYLKNNYSSYEGFISYFPSNIQEFINAFESDRDRWKAVCQIITYQFDNDVRKDNSETLVERLRQNPDFDTLELYYSPSGEHSGYAEELIEDYKANPDSWDEYDVEWLKDYAKYEDVPFEE